MQKRRIIIFLTIIVAILIGLLFFTHKKEAISSSIYTVTSGDIIEKVTAVGNIVAAKTASVKSPISGIVAQLLHQEGDFVKEGDALLVVKPQPTPKDYATAKQQVEADLITEKASLDEVERSEGLIKIGAIAKHDREYEKMLATYKNNRLKRELDQKILALMEEGKTNLQDKTINNIIYSPIDGFIVERVVNLGDPVTPQTDYQTGSVLLTVADMQSLIFKGQVSEADAAKLHLNVDAIIKLIALPDIKITGKVTQLGLQSVQLATPPPNATNNPTSSSNSPFNVGYKIEIGHLSAPPQIKLRAGFSATAEIIIASAHNVPFIPERLLQFEKEQTYVWKVENKNKPIKQFISVGLSDGVNVQVLKGLKIDDQLLEVPPDEKKL